MFNVHDWVIQGQPGQISYIVIRVVVKRVMLHCKIWFCRCSKTFRVIVRCRVADLRSDLIHRIQDIYRAGDIQYIERGFEEKYLDVNSCAP